jgi:hypothetical protein
LGADLNLGCGFKSIEFVWSCCKTRYDGDNCGGMEHDIHYEENDKIIIEYRDV